MLSIPFLLELRQWSGDLVLMKIKSHTGCLLNERADEYAELGRSAEGPELCCHVDYCQRIVLCGNKTEIGDWNVKKRYYNV